MARRAGKLTRKTARVDDLTNVGRTIERRLNEIGIYSREDLQRIGPVRAYERIVAKSPGTTTPVCYYLYSLEGALTDTLWDALPESRKQALRRQAGLE
jgi:DNA transformation protein and related proteins